MPAIDLVVSSDISDSARVAQISAMFDVPPQEKITLSWGGLHAN